jgi:predicted nucleic acid-binding protein
LKFFLDTNILLYAIGDDKDKRERSRQLLSESPYISTQVINECTHVLRRKQKWTLPQVRREIELFLSLTHLQDVSLDEIRLAWKISEQYHFSHYDSLILATALSAGCEILYSEDMQHQMLIKHSLRIINQY